VGQHFGDDDGVGDVDRLDHLQLRSRHEEVPHRGIGDATGSRLSHHPLTEGIDCGHRLCAKTSIGDEPGANRGVAIEQNLQRHDARAFLTLLDAQHDPFSS
jgi:hypothetical protein